MSDEGPKAIINIEAVRKLKLYADDNEARYQFVADWIRKKLENMVGVEIDCQAFQKEAMRVCTQLLEKQGSLISEHGYDILSRVMSVFWLGMPEDLDLHAQIRSLSDGDLALIVDNLVPPDSGLPMSLFFIEQLYREDKLGNDWEIERISATEANILICPKVPLNYIKIDVSIPVEDDNGGDEI